MTGADRPPSGAAARWYPALLALLVAGPVSAQGPAVEVPASRVDSVFARWASLTSPGCAAAVSRNGEPLYARGFGAASIELGVPNDSTTVFHGGSIAKQFTAYAILLLERDGRLRLDDTARTYLPELPPAWRDITLRQLLLHTGGGRDYQDLLWMSGGRDADNVGPAELLELLSRQGALNFAPGTQLAYSNTGYALLAIVVERVSGRPLADIAGDRIFAPLGMRATTFRREAAALVPGRAMGYRAGPGGSWRLGAYPRDIVGDAGLFTTVGDLLRWTLHLDAPPPDQAALVRTLESPGLLANGTATTFGMGLELARLAGSRAVGHGGRDFGYQGYTLRVPDAGLAVAVLCNARDIDAYGLARRVAALYLPPAPTAGGTARPPDSAGPPVRLTPAQMRRLAAVYWNPGTLAIRRVAVQESALVWVRGAASPLLAVDSTRLRFVEQPGELEFAEWSGGLPREMRVASGGRITAVYRRAAPWARPPRLSEFAGTYASRELGVTHVVTATERAVSFATDAHWSFAAEPVFRDAVAAGEEVLVEFTRDARGRVTGYRLSTTRARNVVFTRVRRTGR